MSALRSSWALTAVLGFQSLASGLLASENLASQFFDATGVKIHVTS